jgi:peptidoglycan/LPS O-acetylase OafA/YrhL
MSSIPYRPEVDGLRAVAIIPVVLFHLGAHWLPGGFTGVDVFFVISGYLITSIILKELATGTFTLSGFWARRVRRIFPVLVTCIFVTTAAGYLVGYRNEMGTLGIQAFSALFSFANIYMWRQADDYWGAEAENSPFLHCWSLSVEEQFYLIIPVLFLFLRRFNPGFKTLVLSGIVLLSLLLFAYTAPRYPATAFYMLPMRAWELGLGCLLALAANRRWNWLVMLPRSLGSSLGLLGLVFIIGSYFLLPEGVISLGLLFPTLGAFLVIAYADSQRGVGRLLSHPLLVAIGKGSFSLYMWHWPVIVIARQLDPVVTESPAGVTLLALLSCFLAAVSYFIVEKPLRKSPATIRLSGVGLAACVLLIVAIVRTDENTFYDISVFQPLKLYGQRYDNMPARPASRTLEKKMAGVVRPGRDPANEGSYAREGIILRHGADTPQVIVLGDSHAVMWAKTIDDVCAELGVTVAFWCAAGASPFMKLPLTKPLTGTKGFSAEQKYLFDKRRLETIAEWRAPVVVLSVLWSTRNSATEAIPLIEYIGQHGGKVLIIEQPPEVAIGNRNAAQYLAFRGFGIHSEGRQTFKQSNRKNVVRGRQIIDDIADRYEFVQIVRVADLYEESSGDVFIMEDRNLIYYDDDHLSSFGTAKAASRIKKGIEENL